ncbi:MAG: hypothetical protein HY074_18110 [Deltaproteobacteria bacterium]|nr:hypothetical protein [Deltaproteobacteria bacterium]
MVRSSAVKKILPFLFLFAGVAVGALIPEYSKWINIMGKRLSSPDMATDYIIGVMWAVGIAISIPFWPVAASDKKHLLRLWMVRCTVTLGFMLYYEYHYPLDANSYHLIASGQTFDFGRLDIGRGTDMIAGILWTINHTLPTYDSYHALKVISSLIGFLAVYLFYRGYVIYLGRPIQGLLYVLMLWPSILFWSSILGKDPVHLFGISLYVYGVIGWMKKHKTSYTVPMAIGLAINLGIRVWSAAIFIAPFGLVSLWRAKSMVRKIIMAIIFAYAAQFAIQKFIKQFEIETVSAIVKNTHSLSRSWNKGGSARHAPAFTSLSSMIAFTPLGMFTALFRPLPGEVLNIFGVLAGFENLILLSMLLVAIKRGALVALRDDLALWSLCLLLIWSAFYGFISFQNLGAAVRFRLQVLPILIGFILFLSSKTAQENVRLSRIS